MEKGRLVAPFFCMLSVGTGYRLCLRLSRGKLKWKSSIERTLVCLGIDSMDSKRVNIGLVYRQRGGHEMPLFCRPDKSHRPLFTVRRGLSV